MADRIVTAGSGGLPDETDHSLAVRRLELDIEDLRFENDRLKASITEKQSEIMVLLERLATLQSRLDRLQRVTAWSTHLTGLRPLRLLLRRRN